jgi:hypothetical protein
MPRTNRRFQPSLGELELRLSLSAIASVQVATVQVATVQVAAPMDDDPGSNDPLPEPEPPPPPFPGGDPPLGWPPIPKSGPVGPG